MEQAACNIIYLDRRAQDETIRKDQSLNPDAAKGSAGSENFKLESPQHSQEINTTIESILSTFSEVHVCSNGGTCLSKITELHTADKDNTPIIVLIDIPYDDEQRAKRLSRGPRGSSPTSTRTRRTTLDSIEPNDIYGMHILTHISSEIQSRNLSKLVVPVAVLGGLEQEWLASTLPSPTIHGSQVLSDTVRLTRYLDAGAVDVVKSPLSEDNARRLAVHAYRVFKEVCREDTAFLARRRTRKLSWVGVEEAKPYAYLREAMVSGLMGGICNPEHFGDMADPREYDITEARKTEVTKVIGSWSFSAHDFTDDELIHGARVMLEHALAMPELEKWRIPSENLMTFLYACRTAYNDFVLYHNFRHVVDVVQAIFCFLVEIGGIPSYPKGTKRPISFSRAPMVALIKPFDALNLLVSAIGHDVGHPGVNNAFLVALNAPLAQLYNDRSVLESFHCAAYSQILRRYWPSVFEDRSMRRLMINSILATDMGLHFKYMTDLGHLQDKLTDDGDLTERWNVKEREEYRDLACGLLIKCADISNVARKYHVAAEWARILTAEFARQGTMESDLKMPSCLFGGPPDLEDMLKLAESQISFINVFARPLFEGVATLFPTMSFCVDELITNNKLWRGKIEEEKAKPGCSCGGSGRCQPGCRKSLKSEDHERSPISSLQDLRRESENTCATNRSVGGSSETQVSHRQSLTTDPGRRASETVSAVPFATLGKDQMETKEIRLSRGASERDSRLSSTGGNIHAGINGTGDSKLEDTSPESSRPNTAPRSAPALAAADRAVSSHHARKLHDSGLPNGINPGFAASETDVRYLGDGKAFLKDDGTSSLTASNGIGQIRKEKRFPAIRKLWKHRWKRSELNASTTMTRDAESN